MTELDVLSDWRRPAVDPAHPFRSSLAPQPGPHGLAVARAGETAFGDADVALALWRPCVS